MMVYETPQDTEDLAEQIRSSYDGRPEHSPGTNQAGEIAAAQVVSVDYFADLNIPFGD